MRIRRPRIGSVTLSILTAAFLLFLTNWTFWRKAFLYFAGHEDHLALMAIALFLLFVALMTTISVKYATKPLFIAFILISASASYYADTFGILISRDMIQNVALTSTSEARHLVTPDLIRHLALYGLLPSVLICWVEIVHRRFPAKLLHNCLVIFPALAIAAIISLSTYSTLASTFREHRDLIGSLNPTAPVVAAVRYASHEMRERNVVAQPLGRDARQGERMAGSQKPVLTILVIGETARAQNFGLNGYVKDTTPELAARNVAHFTDVSSCGTSTAVSVPCMFSVYPRSAYSEYKALATENLTDVLGHAGVKVKWFDNDAGAYQVADRIPYEFLPSTNDPRFCSGGECQDEILVERLKRELGEIKSNTVLVLHQIGSHGPAYHERYPESFERFKPACHTAQFADCTRDEIVSAYDNTIAYTDHVLAEIIDLLHDHTEFAGSLLFLSDHGESLGENGLYLHGTPYFLAPKTQTQVPMVAWFSDGYQALRPTDLACLKAQKDAPLSQDNLFHTMLGMMDVSTNAYDKGLDAFAACRDPAPSGGLASAAEPRS
ncbi:phosphoethanolamine transferase [Aureimonas sp. AU40]|uniref:phosphoethanolamine transferase n=1 Tax=Aureimonas sp. AU40 TaxID=1637747 RepID=UPI000781EB39|nr:phosphoethanolamine--lipid A transferase [Aureimonas sp. AU40]